MAENQLLFKYDCFQLMKECLALLVWSHENAWNTRGKLLVFSRKRVENAQEKAKIEYLISIKPDNPLKMQCANLISSIFAKMWWLGVKMVWFDMDMRVWVQSSARFLKSPSRFFKTSSRFILSSFFPENAENEHPFHNFVYLCSVKH